MYFIIIIHEFGHVIIAYLLNWNIQKITIYPFGGYTLFDEKINKPQREELLVLLSGPILQILLYLLVLFLYNNNYINIYIFNTFYSYHYTILFFNLLPIHPLDGSKILNIILNNITSFKKSHIITIYVSYIFLIFIIFFFNKLNVLLLIFILLFHIIKEHKNHIFIFYKFLLERYLYSIKYKTVNIIKGNNIFNMKKNKRNVFVVDNKYIDEKDILSKIYNK